LAQKQTLIMKESGDFMGTQQIKTVQYSAECWNERHFNNNKINQLRPESKLRSKVSGVRIALGAPVKQKVRLNVRSLYNPALDFMCRLSWKK
jgi:hypothetical protein